MNITNYPFYQAFNHLDDFFGVRVNENDFESIGLHGWRLIGNRRYRKYKYTQDTVDCRLSLPCNMSVIESVHGDFEDYQKTDNVFRDNYRNSVIEQHVESRNTIANTSYQRGKLLNFHQEQDELVFDRNYKNVTVIYRGVIADEEGLPFLNAKEVQAIATYVAYQITYKKAMQTKDQQMFTFAADLKQKWDRACLQARTPERMTQNEMDEILDAMTSWDRKKYGISYKPTLK